VITDRSRRGQEAEARAAQRVAQAGFEILERNFNCRLGELDIVARRGQLLIVAEVRLRSRQDYGGAASSITRAKQRRIARAARYLLARRPTLARLKLRFDTLLLSEADGPIDWIEGAFE
jgi:putative endonuclease